MGVLAVPPSERFEGKYEPEPTSGCWLWTPLTPEGSQGGNDG